MTNAEEPTSLPQLIVEYPRNVREIPIDAGLFLYPGAAADLRLAHSNIASGRLGPPVLDRINFSRYCFDYLDGLRVDGRSKVTVKNSFFALRTFVAYADASGAVSLSREECMNHFIAWGKSLEEKVRVGKLQEVSAWGEIERVAKVLHGMLGVPKPVLLGGLRVRKRQRGKTRKVEKQGTGVTHGFLADVRDIITDLSLERIAGALPVRITLRSNGHTYEHWARTRPTKLSQVEPLPELEGCAQLSPEELRIRRRGLLNLRVSAEYHLFIANTGINAAQASQLTVGDFRYESFKAGYNVRKYKGRKGGDVEFWISKGYRPFFESYLAYRRCVYADLATDRLFVILANAGQGAPAPLVNTQSIRYFQRDAQRPYASPVMLRATKANVVQRITGDVAMTSLVMQNTPGVLRKHYLEGNTQEAIIQFARYFESIDPAQVASISPAAGDCKNHRQPSRAEFTAEDVPKPDCVNPKGCLFCVQHRGISSLDYAWAQASYREYLRLELGTYKRTDAAANHPVVMVIERIADELETFSSKSAQHLAWVEEACQRVAGDDFHPHWRFPIELLQERL